MIKPRLLFGLLLSFIFITACNDQPAPTTIASSPVVALPTVAPTASAIDTPTSAPPPPTLAPVSTTTAVPTALASPTPTLTPTPASVTLITLADFAPDRNPLTGERLADPANLQRRPLAVKISNSPPEFVRPQSGLSHADLVFEHLTEGAITRFTAVYYGQTPPDIGPIRSARLIDLEIPAMYDSALAYSGVSIGVSRRLNRSDFESRLLRSQDLGYYRTGEEKPWEHTLHGDPAGFWQALDEKGENQPPQLSNNMAFSSEPPLDGQPASGVQIAYKTFALVEWQYDVENGRYFRWIDGEPHIDANNDEQLSAANVLILYALHQQDVSICEAQSGRCVPGALH